MTPEEMDRVLADHIKYETNDDVDGVISTFTDDIEHDVVGFPAGPQRGTAAVRRFYQHLFALLEEGSVKPVRRWYSDDALIDESIYTGVVDGRLVGLEGKKGRASFRLLHIFEFRDGRIGRENVWQDSDAIRAQLGAQGVVA